MEKIIIEKDNCNDVEHFVKFNLHKYNQKNCDYIRNNSSYAHNNTIMVILLYMIIMKL